jgi:hypothetical protein
MIKLLYKIKIASVPLIVLITLSVQAHPGGHGGGPQKLARCGDVLPCDEKAISSAAQYVLNSLVETGELPPSWESHTTPTSVRKVAIKGSDYWLAKADNPEQADPNESHFYILISNDGYFQGMNFREPAGIESFSFAYQAIGIGLIVILAGGFYFFVLRRQKAKVQQSRLPN